MQILIELALQIFYTVTNDLIELKDMSTMCMKDFLRSEAKKQVKDEGGNNDYRMLYQKEFFMQVKNNDRLFFPFTQLMLMNGGQSSSTMSNSFVTRLSWSWSSLISQGQAERTWDKLTIKGVGRR